MLITEALEEGRVCNDVIVIKDGYEAIQFLERTGPYGKERRSPDLILLDVNLPKMNGHEVLLRIKNNATLQHIPVIMLTTSSDEKDIYEAYKNHVNCYITKPVDVRKFVDVVASIESFWISIVQIPHKMRY